MLDQACGIQRLGPKGCSSRFHVLPELGALDCLVIDLGVVQIEARSSRRSVFIAPFSNVISALPSLHVSFSDLHLVLLFFFF